MWNYRIMHHSENGHDYYALREIIYGDNGEPMNYVDHIEVVGDTPKDIIEVLFMMSQDAWKSFNAGVLEAKDFEKGGKYESVTAEWVEEAKEMIKRVENKEERDRSYMSADEMWEKFEIEGKKTHRADTERIIFNFLENHDVKALPTSGKMFNEMLDKIAGETYESWHKDEEKEEDKKGT